MKQLVPLLAVAAALSGCAHFTVPRYAISVDDVQRLRSLHQKYPQGSIAVGTFRGVTGDPNTLSCRGAGPVQIPDGMTYSQYLAKALADEAKMAEVYSDHGAPISASLQKLDFSSTDGYWTLSASVSAGKQQPYEVGVTTHFDSSFLGDTACASTATAFVPTTQDFLKKLLASPQFEKAFAASAAGPNT